MDNNITFREHMSFFYRDFLIRFAAGIGIRGASRLKKKELIERIAEIVLTPENLIYRLAILDAETIQLIEEGHKRLISGDEYKFGDLELLWLGLIGEQDDNCYSTISEIWEIYENCIDHEKFETYRAKASYVWMCHNWIRSVNGITPESVFLKVVNANSEYNMTLNELREIYDHFPGDLVGTKRVGNEYISDFCLYNKTTLEELRRSQGNKDYYIPKRAELEEYFYTGGLYSKQPYQDLFQYLQKELRMENLDIQIGMDLLWDRIELGKEFNESVLKFESWIKACIGEMNNAQKKKVESYYIPIIKSTNLMKERGYSIDDLSGIDESE